MQEKLFSQHSIQNVIIVITFFLQLISFMTTWQGAELYFRGVFPLAPLLFALAIQGVVYFLCHSLKQKRNRLMVVALLLASLCSSYFSYVGVYTSVIPVESMVEQDYDRYRFMIEESLTQQKSEAYRHANDLVMDFYQQLNETYQAAKLQAERLKNQLEMVDQLQPSASQSLYAPNPNYYADYEDYAIAYQQYIQSLSNSSNVEMSEGLKRMLDSFEVKSVDELNERYLEANHRLNTFELWLGEDPDAALKQMQSAFQSLDCKAEIQQFASLLQVEAEGILEAIDQAFKLEQTELPAFETLKNEDVLKTQLACNHALQQGYRLSGLKEEYIEAVYMLPIERLFRLDTLLLSLSCLLLACLVDGLTLLFASVYWQRGFMMKQKNIAALQRDEVFFQEQINEALKLAQLERDDFLKLCEVDDTYLNQGYSMVIAQRCPHDDVLLSILMQLGVVKKVDERYYVKSKLVFFLNGKGEVCDD